MILKKENGKVMPEGNVQGVKFKMIAKTMMGFEEVLADEIRQLGGTDIEILLLDHIICLGNFYAVDHKLQSSLK